MLRLNRLDPKPSAGVMLESEHQAGISGGSSDARLPPGFPKGLRVLVVDDDSLCLKVVEQMLRKCDYKATTCINGSTALHLLRERPSDFDLVLSDVYMPDMDGFKLLEMVGLEMDLPVIMMSSNGETSTVLRGVTHGAVDFLIKPVRIEELRNVWQHVIRRRRELVKELDSDEHSLDLKEEATEGGRKRKEAGFAPGDLDRGAGDDESNASKKPRVTWSVEMHQKFVGAVNQLGVDKAVPKKILDIMNVDGLTRENVASHLQKYRLYLKRVQGVPPSGPIPGPATTPRLSKPGGLGGIHVPGMPGLQPHINGSAFGAPAVQLAGSGSGGIQNGHQGLAGPLGLGLTPSGAPASPTAVGSPSRHPSPAPLARVKMEPGQPGGPSGPVGLGQGVGSGNGTPPPLGGDSFQQGPAQFGNPGMLGGPMGLGSNPGLSPLLGLPLNPMNMNHMGLGGPLNMPPLPGHLGMLNGMPGGQPGMPGLNHMGMPGMQGMNLNPLNFMPGMGMSPLGMGNNMMGPPMGLMPPGMNMGMGMGMGMGPQGMSQPGMGMSMGQQGMGHPMHMSVGKSSMSSMSSLQGSTPYMPPTSPLPPPMSMHRGQSMPNGFSRPASAAPHTHTGVGAGPSGDAGTAGGSGPASGALMLGGQPDNGDPLEMGDLAGQLGELLQGDAGGPADMGLLHMGDMEGGFPDLDGPGDLDGQANLGLDNKEQGNFDELFNFILKS